MQTAKSTGVKLIDWLHARKGVNALIAVVYFLLVVLPHEAFGKLIHRLFFRGSIPDYNTRFLLMAGGLLAVFLGILFRNLRNSHRRSWHVIYLAVTLLLMVLAYKTIMVLATETIHFPQYAVMAILLFPLTMRYGETLLWVTLLGAIDEGYQYFYLDPLSTGYFDFNDIVLNQIGGALGLIFLGTFNPLTNERSRPWHRSPALRAIGSLLLVAVVLIAIGIVQVSPSGDATQAPIVLFQVEHTEFWSLFHGKRFHVMRPWEGLIVLVLLYLFYYRYFERLRRNP